MVKDLAHSLLADDERLVADAMPHVAAASGRRWRRLTVAAVAGFPCGAQVVGAQAASAPAVASSGASERPAQAAAELAAGRPRRRGR